jgi:hypothetical protein
LMINVDAVRSVAVILYRPGVTPAAVESAAM